MRVIDADALNFVCAAPANDYGCGFLDGIDWAEEEIEKAPTIDDVEKVVHCKDCRYWDQSNGVFWCDRFDSAVQIDGMAYCSYGKRKSKEEKA